MKRTAAILLIGILFFNWYGYQLFSSYWQQHANSQLEAALDRHEYEESSLISVKVRITTLSYYNNSLDFERVDGQITIGNVSYKYVKRRILRDSLELLCIPNLAVVQLKSAENEFFRQVNDLVSEQYQRQLPHPGIPHQKNIQKDYIPGILFYCISRSLANGSNVHKGLICPSLPVCSLPIAERPPEDSPVLA